MLFVCVCLCVSVCVCVYGGGDIGGGGGVGSVDGAGGVGDGDGDGDFVFVVDVVVVVAVVVVVVVCLCVCEHRRQWPSRDGLSPPSGRRRAAHQPTATSPHCAIPRDFFSTAASASWCRRFLRRTLADVIRRGTGRSVLNITVCICADDRLTLADVCVVCVERTA